MGLGSTITPESLLGESENMSSVGASHASIRRWRDLELPVADFYVAARKILRRYIV